MRLNLGMCIFFNDLFTIVFTFIDFFFGSLKHTFTYHSHPTSCASMAEIMAVLFFRTMRYSIDKPRGASNDRFILSKYISIK